MKANMYCSIMNNTSRTGMHGEVYVDSDWGDVETNLDVSLISPARGTSHTIMLASWYNESTRMEMLSRENADASKRPKLTLMLDSGKVLEFTADADATIRRVLIYMKLRHAPVLYSKLFGGAPSDEVCHIVLKFDLSSLTEKDVIKEAKLSFHARSYPASSQKKRMLLVAQNGIWDESTVAWSTFSHNFYSYHGLPELMLFEHVEGFNIEFYKSADRFGASGVATKAVTRTGDDLRLLRSIEVMMDFVSEYAAWDK
jgi:hypothetical protein